MDDVRELKALQLDALREVANIGAGHAATALSQMTNRTHHDRGARGEHRPARGGARDPRQGRRGRRRGADAHDGRPDRPHAGPLPRGARPGTLCDILLRRALGTTTEFGAMEQSGLKEVGNILVQRLPERAVSDFMGMMLVPSVPSLVIDLCGRGAHHDLPQLRLRPRLRLLRRDRSSSSRIPGSSCAGISCCCPTCASLRAIFDAIRI